MSHRYVLLLSRGAFKNRIHGDPGILIHSSNRKDVVANHNRKYEKLYFRLRKSILNEITEICSFSIGAGGRPHRSSRRAPRGGNCWAEKFQPCPASVLPITEAEVEERPPLDAPSLFSPPVAMHAVLGLQCISANHATANIVFLACRPLPISHNALGKPTRSPSSPPSRREVRHASPEVLCRVSMSSVSHSLLPPLRGEPWQRPSWGRRYGAKPYGLSRHRHTRDA